ncbi:MAG: PqqD family protein [Oscillospiraceae bacterium]|nr:PqqD family protein [Oscillospiraceae bacterium]
MKLKDGIITTEVNGEFVAVDAGAIGKRFNGMLKLNKTAAFFIDLLKNETDIDSIVAAMTEKYDVDALTAKQSAEKGVETLRSVGFIDE